MGWFSQLFGKKQGKNGRASRIFLTNTLTREKELFIPLKTGIVSMYSCGPTVYGQAHIGNLRPYVFSDTIARTLSHAGFHLKRVINITDVGHLVGDGDEGDDKMNVAAKREKASPEEIAERYTKLFVEDLADLNIDTERILFPRATEYIKEQIALASTLEEKGFAYRTKEGLYFDTTKFPNYGKLGGLQHTETEGSSRVEVNREKRHPADFALWRSAKPRDLQQWDSPWGRGNPGWHIECSAMIRALLGIEIDIHTGGEDLAQIHHNDEIAQSESANGRPLARYWIHNAFLNIQGEKISKSLGNVIYLSDIIDKKIHPLALRYFFLQAHYRTPVSFSWDALAGSAEALARLWRTVHELAEESKRRASPSPSRERFVASVRDDLSTSQALGILWEALKDEDMSNEEKWGLVEDADALLGLSLVAPPSEYLPASEADLPREVRSLVARRQAARQTGDFALADQLRGEIENSGYRVEDGPEGPVLTRAHL